MDTHNICFDQEANELAQNVLPIGRLNRSSAEHLYHAPTDVL